MRSAPVATGRRYSLRTKSDGKPMKSWPKHCDYIGAYLMLALVLAWYCRANFVEIILAAKQRNAELSLVCDPE